MKSSTARDGHIDPSPEAIERLWAAIFAIEPEAAPVIDLDEYRRRRCDRPARSRRRPA